MRILKFRAWDTRTGEMSPEFSLFGEFTLMGAVHTWQEETSKITGDSIGRLNDLEIMQFTGLKDKNGKEIYEGDIFRIEEDNGIECDFCDGTGTVEGGKYIETTCEKCNGTGIIDQGDRVFYVVITWVKEWAMFCSLLVHSEYKEYLRDGIKALDEPMFWTYTLEDTDSLKYFLCGNIYENPDLLK